MGKETKDDDLDKTEQELLALLPDLSEAEKDRRIRAALADVDAGRLISDEEMDRWMEKVFPSSHPSAATRQSPDPSFIPTKPKIGDDGIQGG